MSASIYTLLADELDISDEKAEKLLSAMLREVNKRARQQENGVQLPNFGRFTAENGDLTFTPTEPLARAVNHRFEGLEPEDLTNAPGKPEEEDEEQDEGPNTIALGYQAGGNFDPIEEEEKEDTGSSGDSAPDTAEFQAPDTGEFDAPDTGEFQAPDTGEFEAPDANESDAPASTARSETETSDKPEEPSSSESESAANPDATTDSSEVQAPDPEEVLQTGGSSTDDASEEEPVSDNNSQTEPDSDDTASDRSTPSPTEAESGSSTAKKTTELYPFVEDIPSGSSSSEEASSSPSDDASPDEKPSDEGASDEGASSEETSSEEPSDGTSSDDALPDDPSTDDTKERDELSDIWNDVAEETGEMSEASSDPDTSHTSRESFESSFPDLPSETESSITEEETESEAEDSEGFDLGASDPGEDPSSAESDSDTTASSDSSTSDTGTSSEPPPSSPPDAPTDSGSSATRIMVAVFTFLLLSSGAWYILGQRGVMPGPTAIFSASDAPAASDAQTAENDPNGDTPTETSDPNNEEPALEEPTSAESSSSGPDTDETENAAAPDETPSTADAAASDDDADADEPTTPSSESSSSTDEAASESGIIPSNGGWSVVVGSRATRDAASQLVSTYRDRIGDSQAPVDILEATVENSTRYRVGVGQFSDRSDAQDFMEQYKSDLPDGAWTVRLE